MPSAAEFPAARIPDAVAELRPQAMLTGLGLDATLVRAAVKSEGAAAFASFPVRTVEPTTKPLSTIPEELAVMQSVLMEHVENIAAQAVGKVVDKGKRRRRDALDGLIERAAGANDERGVR